jgi:predicted N-formylglutamate amidohydrolase
MPEVFETRHSDGDGRFLILCDHASNYVPPELNNLGCRLSI